MKRTVIALALSLATLALSLATVVPTAAQEPVTGAFAGSVVNGKTNAPFGGATVSLTNVETGAKYGRVTDDKGGFYVGRLSPGHYRVEISAPGFKTVVVEQRLQVTQVNTLLPAPIVLQPYGSPGAGEKSLTRPQGGGSEIPDGSRRYALVIGVNKYTADGNISPLGGAVNDARSIADALVKYAGFSRDHVTLLTSDEADGARQPTRTAILSALKNMKNYIEKDGMLVVAFSGHGVERQSDRRAFLLPADASSDPELFEETAIGVDRLTELIKQTGAAYVMLLLDASRNDPLAGKGMEDNRLTKGYADAFDLRGGGVKAFVTLHAASPGERAWEYREKKQGYFSWAFVEGLRGAAKDPATGEVTLARLIEYVQTEVTRRARLAGRRQTPHVVMEGYAGGFVISKAGR